MPLSVKRLAGVCFCWFLASSLSIWPHSLSYFNELVGGPTNGAEHLLGSSFDWGQDLLFLDDLLDSRPSWGPIALIYSGSYTPSVFGTRAVPEICERPLSHFTKYSHIAVSTNVLANTSNNSAEDAPLLNVLRQQTPVATAGYSIQIFDTSSLFSQDAMPVQSSNDPPISNRYIVKEVLPALPTLDDVQDTAPTVSRLVHILRLHRLQSTGLKDFGSGHFVLRVLTDEQLAEDHFAQSPFVRTRNGLRYKSDGVALSDGKGIGESHRDQCLAEFASLGIPLSTPITLKSETCSVSDLLVESTANFTLDQKELAWTAIAYSHYLPPSRQWSDRYSRTTTFSRLLTHLIELGYRDQSCGGTHVLQAIEKIIVADYRCPILDREVRLAGHKYLQVSVDQLLQAQNSDGSWDLNWHEPGSRVPSLGDTRQGLESKLVATGHILELLHELPDPPSPSIARATNWLIRMLNSSDKSDIRGSQIATCALTHALRGIQLSYEKRKSCQELADVFVAL